MQSLHAALSPNTPVLRAAGPPTLEETFESLSNWRTIHNADPPQVRRANLRRNFLRHDVGLSAPPCGVTVCDDPEVIRSYTEHAQLRSEKRIRYRVVNIAREDGSEPLVSEEQLQRQHAVLTRVFTPLNISFQLTSALVRNETLHDHKILYGCKPDRVGDGSCDEECRHELTGNDGGDCDDVTPVCEGERIGDRVCDADCNRAVFDFDGGDCCRGPAASNSCFDPQSRNRFVESHSLRNVSLQ